MEEEKKTKKRGKRLLRCVRVEEFPLILKEAKKDNDNIFMIAVLLAYGAGMRISEVIRCNKDHFRPSSIFIPESKYGVERVVPIPKGWREEFTKRLPLEVTIRTLQRKFKKYSKNANLNPEYTFHSLRHGFATRLLESGAPINQVQILLGHSNLATTSIYTKANPTDAIKTYEDLF